MEQLEFSMNKTNKETKNQQKDNKTIIKKCSPVPM